MRTRRKWAWICICCGIALVSILILFRDREPQYQGRSLSQWVAILLDGDPEISQQQAELAIRSIGTNGLPFYLKWFNYQERPWRTRLAAQAARLPGKFGETAQNLLLRHGRQRRQAAFSALCILGPDAKPALPFLTQQLAGLEPWYAMAVIAHMGDAGLPTILTVLTNGSPTTLRSQAIAALGDQWTRFTATNVVQSVVTACLDDPDREVAFHAAEVLCDHKIAQDRAIRVFAEALESNDKKLHSIASSSLWFILRKNFPPAQLVQYLQDTNSPLSLHAADALGQMAISNPKLPENVLPALTNSLHDPRPKVRLNAVAALSHFKNAPDTVGPALLDAWGDPDYSVRRAATNTFFDLPPYNVLKTYPLLPSGLAQEQADTYPRHYGLKVNHYTPELAHLLTNSDARIREMATNAFRKLGETP
jgi:HEAT repeat protein